MHALFQLLQAWQEELDQSGLVGINLMDLSKACDCLRHHLLVAKFEAYGTGKTSSNLMHNYLSNRKLRKVTRMINTILGPSQHNLKF